MAKTEPPYCKSMEKWLHAHCGKGCLGACTGQDYAALKAFIHLVDAYGRADLAGREHLLVAMRATVFAMQAKTRFLAKKTIPHVLDWSDEANIWAWLARPGEDPETLGGSTGVLRVVSPPAEPNGEAARPRIVARLFPLRGAGSDLRMVDVGIDVDLGVRVELGDGSNLDVRVTADRLRVSGGGEALLISPQASNIVEISAPPYKAPEVEKKYRVGVAVPHGNGQSKKEECTVDGVEQDAKDAIDDMLQNLGVESWFEEYDAAKEADAAAQDT